MNPYNGLQIFYTFAAATRIMRFPKSKNRSKRIHKKLCKRFGGEFWMKPGMFRIDDKLYIHPALRPDLEKALKEASQNEAQY